MYLRDVKRIVVFGPGPRFKGGIAQFSISLCKALEALGHEVFLVSWTQQYPSVIPRDFLDRSSKVNLLEGSRTQVKYITNYNNPFSWIKTVDYIASLNPDQVIFQWAIAIQGLPIGFIASRVKSKLPKSEIIFDVHNVVQKESGALDKRLTRYALRMADTYIMHGRITIEEFRQFMPEIQFEISRNGERFSNRKTILSLFHPNYDIFKVNSGFNVDQERINLGLQQNNEAAKVVFLFFGFIRKYKGLHYALEAFSRLRKSNPEAMLLVAGESFWDTVDKTKWTNKIKSFIFGLLKSIFISNKDQEKNYRPLDLIEQLGLQNSVVVVNRFIPNEEVARFFQVSDAVLNFYEYATPSGVESIAYQFEKPVLATKVGHFEHAIQHGLNGYLAEAADVNSMAATMRLFIEKGIDKAAFKSYCAQYNWESYATQVAGRGELKAQTID